MGEEIFLQIPNVFRPVSGKFETNSNYGVLNTPYFLETNDEKGYFVNYAGLHSHTLRQALQQYSQNIDSNNLSDEELWKIVDQLKMKMKKSIGDIEKIIKMPCKA